MADWFISNDGEVAIDFDSIEYTGLPRAGGILAIFIADGEAECVVRLKSGALWTGLSKNYGMEILNELARRKKELPLR
jgi:hypothetical protein